MATATKKAHAAKPVAVGARGVSSPASLELLVYQDNGGDYHWELVGETGERLAQSGIFASQADAERAARCASDGVGSAQLEPHGADASTTEAV